MGQMADALASRCMEAAAMKTAIVILLLAAWVAGLLLVLPAGS
jgi:hypothetical protein